MQPYLQTIMDFTCCIFRSPHVLSGDSHPQSHWGYSSQSVLGCEKWGGGQKGPVHMHSSCRHLIFRIYSRRIIAGSKGNSTCKLHSYCLTPLPSLSPTLPTHCTGRSPHKRTHSLFPPEEVWAALGHASKLATERGPETHTSSPGDPEPLCSALGWKTPAAAP